MIASREVISRWKSPTDFERWLVRHINRWISGELRTPGTNPEAFAISTPGLTATYVAKNFPAVRAWGLLWQQLADNGTDVSIDYEDWTTRNFGRVRLPRSARVTSVDGVARLLKRSADLSSARRRCEMLIGLDTRLSRLVDHWPAIVAMPEADFDILCRFAMLIPRSPVALMRLREVACEGMHTKFLEQNRGLVGPIMAALGIAGKATELGRKSRLHRRRNLDIRGARSRREFAAVSEFRPAGVFLCRCSARCSLAR